MSTVQPGLLDEARLFLSEFRTLAQERLQLAALETRLAGQSVVRMLVAGIVAAIMLVAAWLALVGAAVVVAVGAGMSPAVALVLAAALNVAAAALLYLAIRKLAMHLAFPRTVRSLR